jgi:hypothetical protein
LYSILTSSICATCPAYLSLLYLITSITFYLKSTNYVAFPYAISSNLVLFSPSISLIQYNNNSIQFLFICMLTQQPKGQLQSEHEWKKQTQKVRRQGNL